MKQAQESFQVGQTVVYRNHVVPYEIGEMVITKIEGGTITAVHPQKPRGVQYTFSMNGTATWSQNLSIAPLP